MWSNRHNERDVWKRRRTCSSVFGLGASVRPWSLRAVRREYGSKQALAANLPVPWGLRTGSSRLWRRWVSLFPLTHIIKINADMCTLTRSSTIYFQAFPLCIHVSFYLSYPLIVFIFRMRQRQISQCQAQCLQCRCGPV